jgi:hypothetical protein
VVKYEDVPEDERWKHDLVMDMAVSEEKLKGFAHFQETIKRQKE